VLLGLLGVVVINALTPYNDYALNNTPMVGNNLPVGVLLLAFGLAVLVNGPLSRLAPRFALSSGELTVTFSMTLVGCAIPSAGLLRYLPPMLVSPLWIAAGNADAATIVENADITRWLLPDFAGSTSREWMHDPLVSGYIHRWDGSPFEPMRAWVRPVLAWAAFLFPLYGALLFIVVLLRRQWVENERLSFPLAQVGLALVQAPEPGRFLNAVLSRRSFWIAFAAVFVLHLVNGLSSYAPGSVPSIPRGYNLVELFSESPWIYAWREMKTATIFFVVVGATYFIPGSIAFSLWFFFIVAQVWAMVAGSLTGDTRQAGMPDQHLGSIIAFALSIFWIGRRHWALIVRQAFRGRRDDEPDDPYLPYPFAFWGLVVCTATMIVWMILAGCTLLASVVAVLCLLALFIVITRVVAETGLIHGMLVAHLTRPWELLAYYGVGKLIPLKSLYLTGIVDGALFDYREVASVYASHGMKIADETMPPRRRGVGWKLLAALAVALVVAYFVGFASTLWTEYRYAVSMDAAAVAPLNPWGSVVAPQWWVLDPAIRYEQGNMNPPHDPLTHIGIGFVVTAVLAGLRLTFASWPLHPIGFLMLFTFPGVQLWFSILLGWLVKTIIVRLGGASLYSSAKPFFLGLILGDSMAAGFWMIAGFVLNALGAEYRPVVILPG
jgi:hypothetical protein